MENLIIGVDADGVLTDMFAFNERSGREFFKKEPVDMNAYHPRDMFGVSKNEEIIFGLKYLEKYCKDEQPREHVVETINNLSENGCEFHEITARKFTTINNFFGEHYRKLFEEWLKKHNIKINSIQYCSESNSPRDKLIGCHKLDVDVMIEDKSDVALYLANNGVKVLLVDAPYNKELVHENIVRVYNWYEIEKILIDLKNNKKTINNNKFKKLSIEEKNNLSNDEKKEYFTKYKNYLKNLNINENELKSSEKKFKLYYSLFKYPVSIIFRPKVKGKENIPYQKGIIFASNHLNSYDQFIISRAIGNRHLSGLAASTIKDTMRGKLFQRISAVFVDRDNSISRQESEEELAKRLVNGHDVLIFPEGTRKDKDDFGKKQLQLKFKLGTVSLSQKTGSPIVPISIKYNEHDSIVKIGEPIFVEKTDDLELANKKLEETILNMTLSNEDKIKKL